MKIFGKKAVVKLTDLPWPKSKLAFGFYLKSHLRDLLKAVSLFNGRLIFSLGISILFGIALVLPGSLWLFYTNLVSLDDDWQGKPGMVVYLEPGTVSYTHLTLPTKA